jgi:hypothetical protein
MITLPVAMLLSTKVAAQAAAYDRPTVNFMLLTHGDAYDEPTSKALRQLPPEAKFYTNPLDVSVLHLPQAPRSSALPAAWQQVLTELTRQNVARKEVAAWYQRKPDGSMSMELIHRRGEFNATDETFLMANATKRGVDELKDLGRKLIPKTYVVALDYGDIGYSASAESDIHTWKATVRAMVFRLQFGSEAENSVYDIWPDEQDSPEVLAEKSRRFEQLPFALEFVQQASVNASASALITGKVSGKQSSGLQGLAALALGVKSKEALLNEMIGKGYSNILNELEKKVAAFKVQAGVWELNPIRAKIGKKEGLKTDQRYYVLEYEQNRKGEQKAVRKAVVRVAGGVADNRTLATGKSEASSFYQIAGRRVEKGMTLEQRNDAGIGLLAGGGTGMNGNSALALLRTEFLTNKLVNLGVWPGLYVYIEGTMEAASYTLTDKFLDSYGLTDNANSSYSFTRADFGLGRGIYFWRNFSLSPYVGLGWEVVSVKEMSFETIYYKAGANFTINIYYPLQLVGGVSGLAYGTPTLKDEKDDDDAAVTDAAMPGKYSDIFSGRSSGGVSGFVGVRINF